MNFATILSIASFPPVVANNGRANYARTGRMKMDAFKNVHCLRKDKTLPLHFMGRNGEYPAQESYEPTSSASQGQGQAGFSLDNCMPLQEQIFGNTKLIRGDTGEEIEFPELNLCVINEGSLRTTVSRDAVGKVTGALRLNLDTGATVEYIRLENKEDLSEPLLVEVHDEDYDEECLSKFKFDHDTGDKAALPKPNIFHRNLRHTASSHKRDLQLENTTCKDNDNRRVITTTIAYDSSYCTDHDGEISAIERIGLVLDYVSNVYSQEGLCVAVKATALVSGCNDIDPINTDPFVEVIDSSSMCGSSSTILTKFRALGRTWPSNAAVHLFFGRGHGLSSTSTVGCAYLDALCGISRFGVNYMSYMTDVNSATGIVQQSVLFAHELGHNAGSGHDEDPNDNNYIMKPFINVNHNGFSDSSKVQILQHISSASCVPYANAACSSDVECDDNVDCTIDMCVSGYCSYRLSPYNGCGGEPIDPTTSPTSMPTRSPSDTSWPTSSPTTVNPTAKPSLSPSTSPTASPTTFPTQAPGSAEACCSVDMKTCFANDNCNLSEASCLECTRYWLPGGEQTGCRALNEVDLARDNANTEPCCDGLICQPDGANSKCFIDPNAAPTTVPSTSPSSGPTSSPSRAPTNSPTNPSPTVTPTASPTTMPSKSPSRAPTNSPRNPSPTGTPTKSPTIKPSKSPSQQPSSSPTNPPPTVSPTVSPTTMPTKSPSQKPTNKPTTSSPTKAPIQNEVEGCCSQNLKDCHPQWWDRCNLNESNCIGCNRYWLATGQQTGCKALNKMGCDGSTPCCDGLECKADGANTKCFKA